MISLTNYDFQWARSELVIIYPDLHSIHGTNQHLRGLQSSVPISWFIPYIDGLWLRSPGTLWKSPQNHRGSLRKNIFNPKKTPKPGYSNISPANWWLSHPSEKWWSLSVGIMKFPIYGKIKIMFQTTNQKISPVLDIRNGVSNHQCCCKSPQQIPAFLSISQVPCKKWKHSWWIGGYSMIFPYQKTSCWLVVSTCFNPSEKYEWIRELGWCFFQTEWKVIK